jgi:hypothetical protein
MIRSVPLRALSTTNVNLSKLNSLNELITFHKTFDSIGISFGYLCEYINNHAVSQTKFFDRYCDERTNGGVTYLLALRNVGRKLIQTTQALINRILMIVEGA